MLPQPQTIFLRAVSFVVSFSFFYWTINLRFESTVVILLQVMINLRKSFNYIASVPGNVAYNSRTLRNTSRESCYSSKSFLENYSEFLESESVKNDQKMIVLFKVSLLDRCSTEFIFVFSLKKIYLLDSWTFWMLLFELTLNSMLIFFSLNNKNSSEIKLFSIWIIILLAYWNMRLL